MLKISKLLLITHCVRTSTFCLKYSIELICKIVFMSFSKVNEKYLIQTITKMHRGSINDYEIVKVPYSFGIFIRNAIVMFLQTYQPA